MRYFCPSQTAFYDEAIHGFQEIKETLTPEQIKAKRKPRLIPNPACTIPADAKPIDDDRYAELMTAQAEGKVIVSRAGRPVAVDPIRSAEDTEAANRMKRDRLLRESDWTQLPDALLHDPAFKLAMGAWRQQLRDMDLAAGIFPEQPTR